MDVWTLAELKKASSAKRKGERSLKWQVRTSDGEQERSVGSVVKQKKTGSLAEVMVKFWCLWTQTHRIDPVQCRRESTLQQIPKWPPICFGLPRWKPKAFFSTFPLHLEYASSSCYVPLWSWYESHTFQVLKMKRWSETSPFLHWLLLLLWVSEDR